MRLPATLPLLLALASMSAGAQLTLRLPSLPAGTPTGSTVFVAGSFNRWAPGDSAWRLAPQGDGSLALTLPASVRGPVEFKLTLGSWERAEATATGTAAPNRQVTIPDCGALTLDVSIPRWSDPRTAAPLRSTATASVRVLSDSFPMPQLGRTRRVWIYLPPGYAHGNRRYPVLYLQDGQNVFDAATAFSGEWGVDETLDSLRAAGDPGAIVVAVDHGGTRRLDEYDPWKNADPKLGGGEGDAYVEFLVRTLKPYVDRNFRTRPDRAHTAVMGSSAGALIALYAALRHPDVFGAAGLFSTASWLAGDSLYAVARQAGGHSPRPRLYFVSGALETPDGQLARDQRRMVDTLRAAGYMVGRSVVSATRADGRHAEWFWRREFPLAYQWLLPRGGR